MFGCRLFSVAPPRAVPAFPVLVVPVLLLLLAVRLPSVWFLRFYRPTWGRGLNKGRASRLRDTPFRFGHVLAFFRAILRYTYISTSVLCFATMA